MPMTPSSPQPKPATPFIDEETRSLFQLGFIVPMDIAFLVVIGLTVFGTLIWILAAKPDFVYIVATALFVSLLINVWTLTVVYRSAYFTLKMRAVMETMPEEAARIAYQLMEMKIGNPGASAPLKSLPKT